MKIRLLSKDSVVLNTANTYLDENIEFIIPETLTSGLSVKTTLYDGLGKENVSDSIIAHYTLENKYNILKINDNSKEDDGSYYTRIVFEYSEGTNEIDTTYFGEIIILDVDRYIVIEFPSFVNNISTTDVEVSSENKNEILLYAKPGRYFFMCSRDSVIVDRSVYGAISISVETDTTAAFSTDLYTVDGILELSGLDTTVLTPSDVLLKFSGNGKSASVTYKDTIDLHNDGILEALGIEDIPGTRNTIKLNLVNEYYGFSEKTIVYKVMAKLPTVTDIAINDGTITWEPFEDQGEDEYIWIDIYNADTNEVITTLYVGVNYVTVSELTKLGAERIYLQRRPMEAGVSAYYNSDNSEIISLV